MAGLGVNLFSQKPRDKLAAGIANTPFELKIAPIRDQKEDPRLMLIISTRLFIGGVKGGPLIKSRTRDQ